ncbi:MAG: arginine--tRNA ligase [Candidatus Parcubacteria bacterium]|nr:MAG: arginine--tRNA ligase [Candidatus Parcubacteria bacterium]
MLAKRIENRLKILGRKLIDKDFNDLKKNLFISHCDNLDHGDYYSNFIFLLANKTKLSAREIFEKTKDYLEKLSYIKKVELINGYLNIFIQKKVFFEDYKKVLLKKENFLKNNWGRNKKLIIEYISANPTGPLHIGNGRGAVLGDILTNVLKLSNFRVTKEYYVNDRGNQIDLLVKSVLHYLGKISNEENIYKGDYLKEFAFKYKKELENMSIEEIKKFTVKYILSKLIKQTLKNFGTNFDNFYFETDLYSKNTDKEVIKILTKKGLIYEKDGATWLNLKKFNEAKDEVLIKNNGEQTYFLSDIIYNYDKFFIRKFHYSIMIVGSDHHDHIRRLQKTFEYIFNVEAKRFKFIEYQMVHLYKQGEKIKMSKRKGEFVTLDELIKEVGVEPIRFYFAKYSPEITINFDLNVVKKENINNQIWYLMYTYARFNKILEKAKEKKFKFDYRQNLKTNLTKSFIYLINQDNYLKIFRRINQFPLVILNSAINLRQNYVISYLLKLADELNSFYEKEIIIKGDSKEIRYKLIFIYYLKNILDLGLHLINIKPKKELHNPIS